MDSAAAAAGAYMAYLDMGGGSSSQQQQEQQQLQQADAQYGEGHKRSSRRKRTRTVKATEGDDSDWVAPGNHSTPQVR
jgi:hypothetical protein